MKCSNSFKISVLSVLLLIASNSYSHFNMVMGLTESCCNGKLPDSVKNSNIKSFDGLDVAYRSGASINVVMDLTESCSIEQLPSRAKDTHKIFTHINFTSNGAYRYQDNSFNPAISSITFTDSKQIITYIANASDPFQTMPVITQLIVSSDGSVNMKGVIEIESGYKDAFHYKCDFKSLSVSAR